MLNGCWGVIAIGWLSLYEAIGLPSVSQGCCSGEWLGHNWRSLNTWYVQIIWENINTCLYIISFLGAETSNVCDPPSKNIRTFYLFKYSITGLPMAWGQTEPDHQRLYCRPSSTGICRSQHHKDGLTEARTKSDQHFIYGPFRYIFHYNDVTMCVIACQIISLTIVYSTVYSGADQRKHQSSASLAFVRGIHRGPVNSPHKGPVTRKMFPFDDVIMFMFRLKLHWSIFPRVVVDIKSALFQIMSWRRLSQNIINDLGNGLLTAYRFLKQLDFKEWAAINTTCKLGDMMPNTWCLLVAWGLFY